MNNKRLEAIDKRIKELRQLLEELEATSERIKQQRQHAAIDHLEDFIEGSDLEVDDILEDITMLRDEALHEGKDLLHKLQQLLHHDK